MAIQNCLNPLDEYDLTRGLFNIQGQIFNGFSASAQLQLFLQSYKLTGKKICKKKKKPLIYAQFVVLPFVDARRRAGHFCTWLFVSRFLREQRETTLRQHVSVEQILTEQSRSLHELRWPLCSPPSQAEVSHLL